MIMTLVNRRVFQEFVLLLAALFAIFWAILRACVQSLTIDEADTYLFFAARSVRDIWYPSSNNHVLNSLLIWLSTHLLGTSSITVRAPALLGAIGYVLICSFLCRNITSRFSLQLPLFICLTYNPLIFDFMVAARGYSMADAFLLAAIAVPVWRHAGNRPSLRTCCVLASVALGLSFTSNFSFAFVDLSAFTGILIWALGRREAESRWRVVEYCALPGLFVALLICGSPLAHWRRADLFYGAHSLGEMARSLVQPTLYRLDPRFEQSWVYEAMDFLRPLLLPLLGILCAGQIVAARIEGAWLRDARARWHGRLAAGVAGIAAASVLMHWLAFRFDDLPLPMGRTGIYLVPLSTLAAGIVAAAPARSLFSQWLRRAITAVFICLASYFLLCLRLTYFEEWKWDADVKDVYSVLAKYNRNYGVADMASSWYYVSSLNYYRTSSREAAIAEFRPTLPCPPEGREVYVLNGVFDRGCMDRQRLVIVYRGKSTDVVIAVKPDGPIPASLIEP